MPKIYSAIGGKMDRIQPVLDVDGNTIIGMQVQFTAIYQRPDLTKVTTLETFDAWSSLSGAQQANMQDIRNTVMAAIAAAYLA